MGRLRRSARKGALLAAAVALFSFALAGCSSGAGAPSVAPTVTRFVAAWSKGDWSAMARLCHRPPSDFAKVNEAALTAIGASKVRLSYSKLTTSGRTARAAVTEKVALAGYGSWAVRSEIHLRLYGKRWRVAWTPATINPSLGGGASYSVRYSWFPRAAVLSANGTPISPAVPTSVVIGLEGSYVKNPTSLAEKLIAAGATSSEASSAITAASESPTTFEPVFTVSWVTYETLEPTLYPVPGVFFQAQGGEGSTPAALVGVVGTLGKITTAQLKKLGAPYSAESTVGQSGLEEAYERRLAGRPKMTIWAVAASSAGHSARAKLLASFAGRRGTPVRTTIDLSTEEKAADALQSAPGEAALVAINTSTGQVIAAANTSSGSDLALDGSQPPGSTMKVITSTALIDKGLTPSSPASCPSSIDVDGEVLHNAEGDAPVSDMLEAFTESCNTAFIGLTMAHLGYHDLHEAAATYRIGTKLDIGGPSYGGSVPVNDGQTDLAASAIGQAHVLLSPLDLAMAASDIDSQTVRTPYLVDGAPAERAPTKPLGETLDNYLHEMMLSVVEHGTTAGTGLPTGTYAKTGTAEYGSGNPLPIDAWLMGFNGHVAFAMIVINSPNDGGPTDGPVVAKFLDSINTTAPGR